jgi:hypothetical protein
MHIAMYLEVLSSFGVRYVSKHATKIYRNILTGEAVLDGASSNRIAGSCGPQLSLPGW